MSCIHSLNAFIITDPLPPLPEDLIGNVDTQPPLSEYLTTAGNVDTQIPQSEDLTIAADVDSQPPDLTTTGDVEGIL